MVILTILILSSVSAYLGYRVWYLAGVLADQQDEFIGYSEYIEMLESTNRYMYDRITKSYDAMQQIDRLGAFEQDDEAGTTFQLLNQVIQELKDQFDGEEEKK